MNAEEFMNRWVEDNLHAEAKKDMRELYIRLLTIGIKIGGTQEPSSAVREVKELIERES
jgi:hypothetical protein